MRHFNNIPSPTWEAYGCEGSFSQVLSCDGGGTEGNAAGTCGVNTGVESGASKEVGDGVESGGANKLKSAGDGSFGGSGSATQPARQQTHTPEGMPAEMSSINGKQVIFSFSVF